MTSVVGLWTYASDLVSDGSRKKRQITPGGWGQSEVEATIRGIPINTQWFNFDAIIRQTCVAKIRLFRNSDEIDEDNQLHSGQISMVLQDSNGYNSMSRYRVRTDTGDNGFCMVIPCKSHRGSDDNTYRGFIVADFINQGQTEELIPVADAGNDGLNDTVRSLLYFENDDNKISVDFSERSIYEQSIDGPFYDYDNKWRYSQACSSADYSHNHFRFYRDFTCYSKYDTYDVAPTNEMLPIPANTLLWHDFFSYFPWIPVNRLYPYKSCFVKVLAPSGTTLEATSYISDPNHPQYSSNGTIYGTRRDCVSDAAVCLEVRPPRHVATHVTFPLGVVEVSTRIHIKPTDSNVPVGNDTNSLIESAFANHVISTAGDGEFQVAI